LRQRGLGVALGEPGIDEARPVVCHTEHRCRAGHLAAPHRREVGDHVRAIHRGVEDAPGLATRARLHQDAHALGGVPCHGRRTFRRLVVGVRVHRHEPQTGHRHTCRSWKSIRLDAGATLATRGRASASAHHSMVAPPSRAPGPPPTATPDTPVGMNEPRSDAGSPPPTPPPDTLVGMAAPRSAAGSPPPTPPPGRYDAERPLGSTLMGKSLAVFLGVLVLALVVAAAFAVYRITSTPSITGEQIGVDVIDDERTDIVIDVTRDEPETAVYCIVRGLDSGKGELGRREVYVPPSEHTSVRIEAPIATTERAYIA